MNRLTDIINNLIQENSRTETKINGVYLYKTNKSIKSTPQLYQPSLIFITNGYKKLYLENNTYQYGNGYFLLVSMPTPIICETFVDNDKPFTCISIKLDLKELYNLISNIEGIQSQEKKYTKSGKLINGLITLPSNSNIEDALFRLINICMTDLDSKILGKSILNEIMFHTIKNTKAREFCNLILNSQRFTQFGKILETIHNEYNSTFIIEDMAKDMNMSIPHFHRNFKAITGYSPIQYIKNIRLNKAKIFLDIQGYSVKETAKNIGYTSQSQFSREYKRYFGHPPISDSKR